MTINKTTKKQNNLEYYTLADLGLDNKHLHSFFSFENIDVWIEKIDFWDLEKIEIWDYKFY